MTGDRNRLHATHVVAAGRGFWRWSCWCNERVREKWVGRDAAKAAGVDHEEAENEIRSATSSR